MDVDEVVGIAEVGGGDEVRRVESEGFGGEVVGDGFGCCGDGRSRGGGRRSLDGAIHVGDECRNVGTSGVNLHLWRCRRFTYDC